MSNRFLEYCILKHYNRILTCGICVLLLSTSTTWANIDSSGYKFSIYGGGNRYIVNPGAFSLIGDETIQLVPNNRQSNNYSYGLGIAYRFLTPHKKILRYTHDISLGMDVFYFQTNQQGTALDYGQFPDFNYRLNIKNIRIMGNLEWTFIPIGKTNILPFLEMGLGAAFNTNYFSDTPNPSAPDGVGMTFSSHTTSQFAYDVGAGLKFMPSKNVELSFRYLYTNSGWVRSGTNASLPVASQYSIPVKTQSLLFGLSYLM